MDFRSGDKVRIRTGKFAGRRGVLLKGGTTGWTVGLDEDTHTMPIRTEDVTNYSAAARLAWGRMPDRKVGRPVGTKVSDRVSVTFRVDRPVWKDFLIAEREGLVPDRTTAINSFLRRLLKRPSAPRTAP